MGGGGGARLSKARVGGSQSVGGWSSGNQGICTVQVLDIHACCNARPEPVCDLHCRRNQESCPFLNRRSSFLFLSRQDPRAPAPARIDQTLPGVFLPTSGGQQRVRGRRNSRERLSALRRVANGDAVSLSAPAAAGHDDAGNSIIGRRWKSKMLVVRSYAILPLVKPPALPSRPGSSSVPTYVPKFLSVSRFACRPPALRAAAGNVRGRRVIRIMSTEVAPSIDREGLSLRGTLFPR